MGGRQERLPKHASYGQIRSDLISAPTYHFILLKFKKKKIYIILLQVDNCVSKFKHNLK